LLQVYCCEYLVDNTSLAFVVADAERNLQVMEYSPESRDSNGGQMLVRRADFNLGQHVNAMFRIRAKITDPSVGGRVLTGRLSAHPEHS
jgi:cleavage and polyadenylation specificity factor subunit 1